MTIEGLVRDVACPMQNHHSTATHFNLKCARACIQNGSPLILLTKTDEIYFPMTDQMPDHSAREQLIPYVGICPRDGNGLSAKRNSDNCDPQHPRID